MQVFLLCLSAEENPYHQSSLSCDQLHLEDLTSLNFTSFFFQLQGRNCACT